MKNQANPNSMLFKAAQEGDLTRAQEALDSGAEPNYFYRDDPIPNDYVCALHAAAIKGNIAMIDLLLDHGADINAKWYSKGYTPFYYAVQNKQYAAAMHLSEYGADIFIEDGLLLSEAVRRADMEKINQLLNLGARPNPPDCSPLNIAVQKGNMKIIDLLMEGGADLNKIEQGHEGKHGSTTHRHIHVTHQAIINNDLKTLKRLIKRGAYIHAIDGSRGNALHWAAKYASAEIAAYLIKLGVNPRAQDICGDTPLRHAVESNNPDVAELLYDIEYDIHAKGVRKENLIHAAAGSGNVRSLKKAIEMGVNRFIKNAYGKTALQIAAEKKHLDSGVMLCEYGADLNEIKKDYPEYYRQLKPIVEAKTLKASVERSEGCESKRRRKNTGSENGMGL